MVLWVMMVADPHQTTWCHNPDHNMNIQCRKNVSHKKTVVTFLEELAVRHPNHKKEFPHLKEPINSYDNDCLNWTPTNETKLKNVMCLLRQKS
jgi:hypothetical protein